MHRVQNSSAARPLTEAGPVASRMDARPATKALTTLTYTHVVHHGGNKYFATAGMAGIFEANAAEISSRGDTELVPLLHSTGVDLLLIGPQTRFTVVAIEVGAHTA
ncbi:hypothetical protein [Subtercola sp. YIM 133946]|uniref:hypothetical protein n=1 Tax=Subtercola sp. YIM 133946 TaxID=3118909 RepID=UPI002F943983